MDLILDGHGPLNSQLIRAFKCAIATGRIGVGCRLPSSRQLASDLGISRTTVVSAYEQLRAEGHLSATVGSGSYVAPTRPAALPVRLNRSVSPQSAYATRLRQVRANGNFPFRRLDNCRFVFQPGLNLVNPALSTLWSRELTRAANYAIPGYPDPQGLLPLRQEICSYLGRRRGVLTTPNNVLIVSGSQQALSLTARILINEGDPVALEEPQYFGTRQNLEAHGARLIGVPVDAEGLITDELPHSGVRLICVTPSHQFPTGAMLSQTRRKALLDYATANDAWIYEDDYDGEYRYTAKPLEALQAQDREGRVIYVGTFSKTLFPALRLAYVVMPSALRDDFINSKFILDFGSNAIEQIALANFMKSGGFDRHLRQAAKVLSERRETLIGCLRQLRPDKLEFLDSGAGAHVLVWLTNCDQAQGQQFMKAAWQRGLGLHSISSCFLSRPDRFGILLSYGALSCKEIHDAMQILQQCLIG